MLCGRAPSGQSVPPGGRLSNASIPNSAIPHQSRVSARCRSRAGGVRGLNLHLGRVRGSRRAPTDRGERERGGAAAAARAARTREGERERHPHGAREAGWRRPPRHVPVRRRRRRARRDGSARRGRGVLDARRGVRARAQHALQLAQGGRGGRARGEVARGQARRAGERVEGAQRRARRSRDAPRRAGAQGGPRLRGAWQGEALAEEGLARSAPGAPSFARAHRGDGRRPGPRRHRALRGRGKRYAARVLRRLRRCERAAASARAAPARRRRAASGPRWRARCATSPLPRRSAARKF